MGLANRRRCNYETSLFIGRVLTQNDPWNICIFAGNIYPYPSGLFHWHWGMIAPVSVKQPWSKMDRYQTNHNNNNARGMHSMMTSSNATIFYVMALCDGNPPATDGFPSQRPVKRSFDVFFDLHQNKRLSKHSRRRWFEMPSRSLYRHCNVQEEMTRNKDHIPIAWG